jgi:hypothetical protein
MSETGNPPFTIDTTSWPKHHNPVGAGYDHRPAGTRPSAIVVHTTNGRKGSSFAGEASFLFNSVNVSAHYLVGKDGRIAQILPTDLRAWHAGQAEPEYLNSRSIGIECHHSVGDDWPVAQLEALTWLVRELMVQFGIAPDRIDTHRRVALPPGRKVDPSDWVDNEYYSWQATLAAPEPEPPGNGGMHVLQTSVIPLEQTIIGGAQIASDTLRAWMERKASWLEPAPRDQIASAFTAFGQLTRIGNLLPFAQAWHETGGFASERWVKSFNPAGLGATNDGAWGANFASPAEGVVAQYAHLLAYAATDEQLNVPQRVLVQLDPRLEPLVQRGWRGIAPRWIDLNGRWAVPGPTYGNSIIGIACTILGVVPPEGAVLGGGGGVLGGGDEDDFGVLPDGDMRPFPE